MPTHRAKASAKTSVKEKAIYTSTEPADDIDEWADKAETLLDDEDDESTYYTIGLAIDLSKADDADDIEYELDQLYSEGEQGFEDERENVLL